jgi:hypothetical protein
MLPEGEERLEAGKDRLEDSLGEELADIVASTGRTSTAR